MARLISQQDKLASTLPFAAAGGDGARHPADLRKRSGADRQLAGHPPPTAKTQVFPLERNAAVRTRLTHSLEVQQVGRYIAKEVLSRLKEQKLLEEYGLEELTGPFESVVEMACLMHDIGNPPFGHFGEAAINDWFRQRLAPGDALGQPLTDDRCEVQALRLHEGETALNALRRKVRQDLCSFEGNAQGIRLVHTLMRMNLTWAQVGCILKYTRPAWWFEATPASHSYLMKKPGYYLAEEEYVARLRKELDLAPYNRFPLTWIMEAADDISYCVADLEDAVENVFSALSSFISIFMTPGATMKRIVILSGSGKCLGKIAS